MDDGPGDGKGTDIGANGDGGEAHEFAHDNGEEGDEVVDDEARVYGAEAHAQDADEREEADDEGGVIVRG